MKKVQLTGLLMFISLLYNWSYAQTRFELSPYAGSNSPTGQFKDFAKNGFDVGVAGDYFFGPNFGLGFDFNQQKNGFKNSFDYSRAFDASPTVPFTIVSNDVKQWTNITIGLGPVYRLNLSKLKIDLYSKAGFSIIETPIANDEIEESSFGDKADLFTMNGSEKATGFGLSSGIRIGYDFNEQFRGFFNTQYVYSTSKIGYFIRDIEIAYTAGSGGENFNPTIAIFDTELKEESLNLSHLNLNVGVTYTFPSKPKGDGKAKKEEVKTKAEPLTLDEQLSNEEELLQAKEKVCPNSILRSPNNKEQFITNSDLKPVFTWSNSSKKVKGYEFRLYKNDKLVYIKKLTSSVLQNDEKLTKILNNGDKEMQDFQWDVKTSHVDCPAETTEKRTITLKSMNGIQMNISEIECLSPAFDQDGKVRYKAKIEFSSFSNSSDWIINSLSLIESNQNISISALHTCTTPTVNLGSFLTVLANTTVTYCFEFSVSIGTTSQTFQTNGTLGAGSGSVSSKLDLPNCICDICKDWQIVQTNEKMYKAQTTNSNIRILSSFQIFNAEPIQQVKAEIISIEHNVSDPECYTCTKTDDNMGMFSTGLGSGKLIPTAGWQNNSYGTLLDDDNDGYGNEFTWRVAQVGVDFSSKKSFRLNLNLPEFNSLSCCESAYKICVRYTFTDINCQTCDYLVCYEYEYTASNSGGGGVGTGTTTGTTSTTSGSAVNLNLKK